jgi:hypothetical protein
LAATNRARIKPNLRSTKTKTLSLLVMADNASENKPLSPPSGGGAAEAGWRQTARQEEHP